MADHMTLEQLREQELQSVKTLMESTNRTLASHTAELKRLNDNLQAIHKTATNHFELIQALAAQGNSHDEAFGLLQPALLRLWHHCFGNDAGLPQIGKPN